MECGVRLYLVWGHVNCQFARQLCNGGTNNTTHERLDSKMGTRLGIRVMMVTFYSVLCALHASWKEYIYVRINRWLAD